MHYLVDNYHAVGALLVFVVLVLQITMLKNIESKIYLLSSSSSSLHQHKCMLFWGCLEKGPNFITLKISFGSYLNKIVANLGSFQLVVVSVVHLFSLPARLCLIIHVFKSGIWRFKIGQPKASTTGMLFAWTLLNQIETTLPRFSHCFLLFIYLSWFVLAHIWWIFWFIFHNPSRQVFVLQ